MLRTVAEWEALTGADGLTPAEMRLIRAVRAGEACVLGDTVPEVMTPDTRIRADLLRLLILGGTPECGLHEMGVALFGGWIEGELAFRYCTARGQTLLNRCRFESRPIFYNAHLRQLSLDGSHLPGLRAQGATIDADLFLRGVLTTATVGVNGARIGGLVALVGARLVGGKDDDGKPQDALNAQGLETGDDLFLRKVQATGTVNLMGAKIGGQLSVTEATLDGGTDAHGKVQPALLSQRMRVTEGFYFRDLPGPKGRIDLTSAHVGDLVDAAGCWPVAADSLILDGFTYDRIESTSPTTLAARRRWLEVGSVWKGTFTPQPYTHFARVLREAGHAAEARRVLYERDCILFAEAIRADRAALDRAWTDSREDIGKAWARLAWDRVRSWVLRAVIGHGHKPERAGVWLLGLTAGAWLLAFLAWQAGDFAPNSAVVLTSADWKAVAARSCDAAPVQGCDGNPAATWSNAPDKGLDWDSFHPAAYAVDLVLPLVDLGQTAAWAPSKDRGFGGWVLWWARWGFVLAGWIAVSLGVAAITGLVQKNTPD